MHAAKVWDITPPKDGRLPLPFAVAEAEQQQILTERCHLSEEPYGVQLSVLLICTLTEAQHIGLLALSPTCREGKGAYDLEMALVLCIKPVSCFLCSIEVYRNTHKWKSWAVRWLSE